ncbi:metal-binding protein [Lusitaniella coriacea]|uniref:metal-binding protein n=1 Tax=Lusitaniella coriacea TaxID=1983105 RepID=UPI003CF64DAD
MPSGRTHDRITLWSFPWIVGLSFFMTRNGELTLIVASAFLFSGLMFGPDLDIYSVQYKRWGMLRWVWLPYQKALRHRSRLSHGFVVGTTLRLIYLTIALGIFGGVVAGIAQLLGWIAWDWSVVGEEGVQWVSTHRWGAIALWVGLELGAMSHAIADSVNSTYKQIKKKGLKTVLYEPKKKKRRRSPKRKR